jgi:hypothetical protein
MVAQPKRRYQLCLSSFSLVASYRMIERDVDENLLIGTSLAGQNLIDSINAHKRPLLFQSSPTTTHRTKTTKERRPGMEHEISYLKLEY